MRGCLLFAGDTRVKRSSNRCHRTLRAKALRRLGRVQARRWLEQNLTGEENYHVRNKYAYFLHGQNYTGGTDKKLPTPPATATHLPIRHTAVVETLIETPSHRHIG